MKKSTLGNLMLATPFVGIFIFSSISIGVLETIGIFIGVVMLTIWFCFGALLSEEVDNPKPPEGMLETEMSNIGKGE